MFWGIGIYNYIIIFVSVFSDLWGVVNNAGINYPGDIELVTIEQFKKVAEVNIYGMLRVIKASLPLIRASKGNDNMK